MSQLKGVYTAKIFNKTAIRKKTKKGLLKKLLKHLRAKEKLKLLEVAQKSGLELS